VKNGIFHQGYFNANPYNFLEVRGLFFHTIFFSRRRRLTLLFRYQANVRSGSLSKPILLVGRSSMNRAIDGDVVVVQLLPENEWKAPGEEVVDQDGEPYIW
jgi:exosome complex exonuclease DIS3/RRP44